ncbi:MAG: aromatic amino acid transport family protein [bacterium]|nr:aromatic amino acid transport family protein [bacterium]
MADWKASLKIIEGTGLFLGMLIGAGIFALPYSFLKGGFFWSLFLFAVVFFLSLILHYLYAGVICATPGKHRFAGYARRHLGVFAEKISLVFTFISFEGAMLAYGVLGGIFLNVILSISFLKGGLLFLFAGGFLFLLPLASVGGIDFILTVLLFGFVSFLSLKLGAVFEASNLFISGPRDYFFPYGVFLFAFGAYSALPDIRDLISASSPALFKRIIFWGLGFGAFFYLFFTIFVLGASGMAVSEDSFTGLVGVLGKGVVSVGALIGLLSVFRTYIALGTDLKLAFRYDYSMSEIPSWLLAFLPSLVLFLFGFTSLSEILRFVGSIGLGVFAIFIILMAWRLREKVSDFLGFELRAWWLLPLGILVVLGALQDIFSLIWK